MPRNPRPDQIGMGGRITPEYAHGRAALSIKVAVLVAELKGRSDIEPVIGHMKADLRMSKNHLKGRSAGL